MPKRKISSTASKLKKGRGQGSGIDYQPFLKVREVPSKGLSHRTKGLHTLRVHHSLSTLEHNYLLILDWSQQVADIREQYPLPLDETLSIANRLSIIHPPAHKDPDVMTTDFVIDIKQGESVQKIARTLKFAKDLNDGRVIEKFEIERTYWTEQGIDWGIVTELDIPDDLVQNLRWLRQGIHLEDLPNIDHGDVSYYEEALFSIISANTDTSLAQVGKLADTRLCFEPGTGLSLIRYFISTRIWQIDMMKKIIPSHPMVLLDRTNTWKDHISNG